MSAELSRRLLIATIGGGNTFWGDFPAYIAGPVIGGALAAIAYDVIARPRELERAPAPIGASEPTPTTEGFGEGRRTPGPA